MTHPSAVLFTTRRDRLAEFYGAVIGLQRTEAGAAHVVLTRGSFELVLHDIPARFADGIVIATPPAVRESSAVKLVFPVADLAEARTTAATLGGRVYGPEREWRSDAGVVCDGFDPDGNVFQLVQGLEPDPMPPENARKLPARFHGLVMPLLLSALMTCVVSLISTLRSVGLIEGFVPLWLGAWGLSWVVAFPLLLFALPLARAATSWWVEEP